MSTPRSVPWIEAGSAVSPDLPEGQLTRDELVQLQRLLEAREGIGEQLRDLDRRLELFTLAARDRRGLSGPIRIHPGTGQLVPAPPEE